MAGGNRYSTTVAWTKVALPLIALALLSTLFLFSSRPDPEDALQLPDVDVDQLVREQRLSRPRFAGTLDDGREVSLIADTAAAATENPNTILLTRVEGRVALSEAGALTLTADAGDLDLGTQSVVLAGSVQAGTSDGFSLETENLRLGMDSMRLTAPGSVVLTGIGIRIEAGAMDATGLEDAAFLSFTGGVRLLYQPEN